ncbi:MAG: 2-oxo acid dehydrogenase subunit E2, partial [Symploca sp. SIO2B6]|nr:2-oxo acid dehydrogenase subunit E2 [Symploca sp. SIO2B6]
MIHEVFMPALSSTMTEGKIVSWSKAPGDKVEKGETILVVESDKADMDVEAFYEGYLATIIVPADESAPVGEAIALIAETEAEIETAKQQATSLGSAASSPAPATAPAATASVGASAATPVPQSGSNGTPAKPSGRVVVSPRARKLAKSLKVDLTSVQGSGPHGRIVAADVEAIAGVASSPSSAPAAVSATPVGATTPSMAAPAAAPVIPPTPKAPPVTLGQVAPF